MMTEMKNYETELTEDELMDVNGGIVISTAIGYGAYVGLTCLGIYLGWKAAGCKKK